MMGNFTAKMEYRAEVVVDFETDKYLWKDIQLAAVEAAHDQGLIPEGWLSVAYPLVEPAKKFCGHGCGAEAGNDGYCDNCYADQCLIGPDGECRYTIQEDEPVESEDEDWTSQILGAP